VKNVFSASQTEAYLNALEHKPPAQELRLEYWKSATRRIETQDEYEAREFPMADGEALFRDLKFCLSRDPI
jgi:hypothetical protein